MAYWLFKSEPEAYSWDKLVKDKRTGWTGVRNYQANNNMKAMKVGDLGFFYHSVSEKSVVGVAEVSKAHHPDPTDETARFGMVEIKALKAFPKPVTLDQIKADPRLQELALIRQSRLSVMPIDAASWKIICGLGGYKG
ncbi:MAG TPA: EVE domain-containing protein [Alphaproteobacteria bacterium]|nr:EVE domain-containing protein [Alphaproteobacteria bacterium]